MLDSSIQTSESIWGRLISVPRQHHVTELTYCLRDTIGSSLTPEELMMTEKFRLKNYRRENRRLLWGGAHNSHLFSIYRTHAIWSAFKSWRFASTSAASFNDLFSA